jgi:hypothetical protein
MSEVASRYRSRSSKFSQKTDRFREIEAANLSGARTFAMKHVLGILGQSCDFLLSMLQELKSFLSFSESVRLGSIEGPNVWSH